MSKYGWRDGKVFSRKLVVQDKMAMQYVIPKTSAYATGALVSDQDFNAASTAIGNIQLVAQPTYPANLVVTANAVGTAGANDVLIVKGEDQFGDYAEETFVVKSTAAATTAGAVPFGKIDSIGISSGQTSANTTIKSTSIGIGFNNIVGLPWPIASSADIISYAYDGAHATTAVDQLTIDTSNHTLKLPAMAVNKVVSVIYKTKLQKSDIN